METQSLLWLLGGCYLIFGMSVWSVQTFLPEIWCSVVGKALHRVYPSWSFEELHATIHKERVRRSESVTHSITHSLMVSALWPLLVYILFKK